MDQERPRILRIVVGTTNPSKIKAVEQAMRRIMFHHNPKNKDDDHDHHQNVVVTPLFDLDIRGCNVPSNVSEQPWDDYETKCGAMNRARNAYYYYEQQQQQEHSGNDNIIDESNIPHLGIGIEGGLQWENSTIDDGQSIGKQENQKSQPRQLYCMAWIAIYGHRTKWTTEIFGNVDGIIINSDQPEDPIESKECCYGLSKTAMFILPQSLRDLIEEGVELGKADDIVFRRTNSKQASGTVGLLTNSMIDRSSYYEHAIQLAIIPWIHPSLYPNGHTHV